ncbi:phosphotransferase [Krasilnikoviella flava]|uniref:Aminoglycoside phosphotransferase domain-containing protein n=1 Tax=Krasilnikoviella flava TaxID=526729 RepID=A0A1T5IN13_9MICO|nr:phosphotransferase [Krasilnikoviella flava]SKC40594.1 hypothetical protein SAMN04324258_0725 [Krasilnikoviella flava]
MAPDLAFDRARPGAAAPTTVRDVAAGDPAIPALADVLDLERLTALLAATTGTPGEVSRPYLRHKPGTSVVLSCRWTPRGPDGAPGTSRDLLVRGYADGARSKLDKGLDPRRPHEVLLLDRDAGLVVTDWTADRQLPAARDVAAVAAATVGGTDAPGARWRLLRHNPERRAVVHAAGPDGEVVVRLVRPAAVARAAAGYALLGAVSDGGTGTSPVRAPRLRAVDADRGVLVTDWVPGDPLDRLDDDDALDDAAFREVGALAAALHGAPLVGDAAPVRPSGTVPVHGDLSLDQVVRAMDGELWLVDGDAARWGRPADDLGSFAAALVRAHDDPEAAAVRLAAVLDGYAEHGDAVDVPELRAAVAEHLRRRATEPFRRLEAGWAGTSRALAVLADEVADGWGGALGDALAGAGRSGGSRRTAVRRGVSRSGGPTTSRPWRPAAAPAAVPAPRIRTAPVAAALADAFAAQGHVLRAVLPRSADRLLVVGAARDGAVLAGRWDAAPAARADRRAGARTGGAGHAVRPGAVPTAGGGLVLQPGGADPRLPGLADRVRRGAVLVAHRAGRRGVVRDPAGTYTKVTRPGREPGDVVVPPAAFATPVVVGRGEGWVTTTALPGRTLHVLLRDASTPAGVLDAAGRAVGRGLRRLQDAPAPARVTQHDAAAETAVVARFWGLAVAHGATTTADADAVVRRVRDALEGAPVRRPVLTHRDLHDKQLLVDGYGGDGVRVGLLDLDLAAVAHPALDLANLLVHLELRVHQGVCPPARAARVARAVIDGYGTGPDRDGIVPDGPGPDALRAWAVAARARLAAVYAFRPAPRDVPGALLAGLDRLPTFDDPTLLTHLEDR